MVLPGVVTEPGVIKATGERCLVAGVLTCCAVRLQRKSPRGWKKRPLIFLKDCQRRHMCNPPPPFFFVNGRVLSTMGKVVEVIRSFESQEAFSEKK